MGPCNTKTGRKAKLGLSGTKALFPISCSLGDWGTLLLRLAAPQGPGEGCTAPPRLAQDWNWMGCKGGRVAWASIPEGPTDALEQQHPHPACPWLP